MKSALLVIAQSAFRDEEYAEPKMILESRGVRVTTASVVPGSAIGKLGMRAVAQTSVSAARETEWDAVLFIGGAGAAVFFDDPDAHELAHSAAARGAVLGAICVGPSTLARAGLLNGLRATAFPSQEADLRAHGALWTGESVTTDGLVVTANGPDAAEEFGSRVADLLGV